MGYCDANGKTVIEPLYQKVLPFRGTIAPVVKEGFWWFVSSDGQLRFNSRQYEDSDPPELQNGLYMVQYFDPIFANVTEYYNRHGLPVKVDSSMALIADTIPYSIFNAPRAIAVAKTKMGTPYGEGGLDCSGFMRFIYSQFGIVLPYFAREMAERGRAIELKTAQPGDLIFFTGFNQADPTPNHVGMVVSNQKGVVQFIHTSSSKGVKINALSDAYFKVRYLRCRRIFG